MEHCNTTIERSIGSDKWKFYSSNEKLKISEEPWSRAFSIYIEKSHPDLVRNDFTSILNDCLQVNYH